MNFNWIDYNIEYNEIVEPWLDDDTRCFTSIDDSWQDYVQYWQENSDADKGEYFWSKVIADKNNVPFGVIAVGLYDDIFTVSEYVIDPQKKKYGLRLICIKRIVVGIREYYR